MPRGRERSALGVRPFVQRAANDTGSSLMIFNLIVTLHVDGINQATPLGRKLNPRHPCG